MAEAIAGPEYLRAEDLIEHGKWCRIELTIKEAHKPNTFKAADGKPIDKLVLEFNENPKRMICGTINSRLLRYATGETTLSGLAGKHVTLYAVTGNWFGQKNVAALRIAIPEGQYRPFLSEKRLGRDITGKQFT